MSASQPESGSSCSIASRRRSRSGPISLGSVTRSERSRAGRSSRPFQGRSSAWSERPCSSSFGGRAGRVRAGELLVLKSRTPQQRLLAERPCPDLGRSDGRDELEPDEAESLPSCFALSPRVSTTSAAAPQDTALSVASIDFQHSRLAQAMFAEHSFVRYPLRCVNAFGSRSLAVEAATAPRRNGTGGGQSC